MNEELVLGSRWRKIDFHVHTPASHDYKEPSVTPEQWVKAAGAAGLDAVVVTDHNSGEWIDCLAKATIAANIPLTIIPGCEITVDNGLSRVHLLAVFPIGTTSAGLTAVLGAIGIVSGFGDHEGCHTQKGFHDVAKIIRENGGLIIPAHVDGKSGLLRDLTRLKPELREFLKRVGAVEVCDKIEFSDREDIRTIDRLAQIGGSDAHALSDIGRHYSWVKTCDLSLDALRIAFYDKDNCIRPQSEQDPNHAPDFYVQKLEMSKFKTCGNDSRFPLSIQFSPHLTTLIGGRGTGKSTVVEALRIVFRKMSGQNVPEEIKGRWTQFSDHVLKHESSIRCEFVFHGARFRLNWLADASADTVEECKDGSWSVVQAGDVAQRFPIEIFSQRQVFALAENPKGLLELIDATEDVNKADWDIKWQNCKRDYLRLCGKARELRDRRNALRQLPPRIADLDKKIQTYEQKGYGELLKNLQGFMRQKTLLKVDEDFTGSVNELKTLVERIVVADMPRGSFPASDDVPQNDVLVLYDSFKSEIARQRALLEQTADAIFQTIRKYESEIAESKWLSAYRACQDEYHRLVEASKATGVSFDNAQYERWIAERSQFSSEVEKLASVETELEQVVKDIKSNKAKLEVLRDQLYESRTQFLRKVVGDNPYVRMSLIKYGDVSLVEHDFREIFSLEEGRFADSIYSEDSHGGLLAKLIEWEHNNTPSEDIMKLLETVKSSLWSIAHGQRSAFQASFDKRLQMLYQENPSTFNEASVYLPEDKLIVEYPVDGVFRAIEGGASGGQKAAAILAFLLSYGENPIVIDQPEDDLDNALIMNLVVAQLKANKKRRQMIIVTHNPNIVVNGDSELVNVMSFKKGQIHCDLKDGLESKRIRTEVCRIMEGGEAAFKMRYKRIVREVENV